VLRTPLKHGQRDLDEELVLESWWLLLFGKSNRIRLSKEPELSAEDGIGDSSSNGGALVFEADWLLEIIELRGPSENHAAWIDRRIFLATVGEYDPAMRLIMTPRKCIRENSKSQLGRDTC